MDALEKYKSEVEARFHTINGMDANCVLMLAKDYLQEKINAYDLDAQLANSYISCYCTKAALVIYIKFTNEA